MQGKNLVGRGRPIVAALGVVLAAAVAEAQQLYEQRTYNAQGDMVSYSGPVYGPNPNPNELAALTWNWTYAYLPGYTLLLTETGPMGHCASWSWDAACNNTRINQENGALVITRQWDAIGRQVQRTEAFGSQTATWTYSYPGPRRARVVDPRGKISELQVDVFGRKALCAGPADSAQDLDNLIAAGVVKTYAYDAAGNLVSETNELGACWSRTYDTMGNLLTETDPQGRQEVYSYDPAGRLVSETRAGSPGGLPTRTYSYNSAGQIDVVGNRVDALTMRYEAWGYDAAGNLTTVAGPASSPTDALQQLASGANVRRQFTYDALGRCVSESSADGEVIQRSFDARSNELTRTSNQGHSTTCTYDYLDRRTGLRTNRGGTRLSSYDSLGRVVSETGPWDDANGDWAPNDADTPAVRTTVYNLYGLPTWAQVDSLTSESRTYDEWLPASVTVGTATSTTQYDARGHRVLDVSAAGCRTARSFDAAGRLVSERRGGGTPGEVRIDYAYNLANQPLGTSVYPNSGSASLSYSSTLHYDAAGRIDSGVDFDGTTWTRTYDAAGRLTGAGPTSGLQSTFSWDQDGLLVGRSARGGPFIAYAYDSAMRVLAVTEGGTRTWTTAYDSVGRVANVTYPDGSVITYGYDSAGRLATEAFGAGYTRSYSYDGRSRLVGVSDPCGSYAYSFDRYDQMLSRTDQAGRTLAVTYSGDGSPSAVTYPGGDVFAYSYDAAQRLSAIQRISGGTTTTAATVQYDALDRVGVLGHANGCSEVFAYDGVGRQASIQLLDGQGALIEGQAAARDPCGRLLGVTHASGDVESYSYDLSGQMVSASRTGAAAFSSTYGYDAAGNLAIETLNGATTSYTRNGLGEVTAITDSGGTTSFAYDPMGRETQRSTAATTVTTTYDVRGLPTSVADSASGKSYSFGYDPWGKRVFKSDGTTAETYVYDGMFNRVETYGNGALTEVALAMEPQRVFETWSASGNQAYFFSMQGNVDRTLAASGSTNSQYVYDPFGKTLASSGSGSRYKYQGLAHDVAFDAYDNVARLYSPSARGFEAPDPLRTGPAKGTFQRAWNDPVNYSDVTGLCEHGRMVVNGETTESTTELGATLSDQAEFECHTELITYWPTFNGHGSTTDPCWYEKVADCDKASVMKTSDCTAKIKVVVAAVGSTIRADLNHEWGGYKRPYYIDEAGAASIKWHEEGHLAIVRAYLEGFWERGKKSLGGATNKNPNHDEEASKAEAQQDWDRKWNALKNAMQEWLKKSTRLQSIQEGYHIAIYANPGPHRGNQDGKSDGPRLIDDQRYGGADPKSHENNVHAQHLQAEARSAGSNDCPAFFHHFPCRCRHK